MLVLFDLNVSFVLDVFFMNQKQLRQLLTCSKRQAMRVCMIAHLRSFSLEKCFVLKFVAFVADFRIVGHLDIYAVQK